MIKRDYKSVLYDIRLANGTLFPIPIVLDIYEELAKKIGPGSKLTLKDPEGHALAILTVESVWKPNRLLEAEKIYQTTDLHHSGVNHLINHTNPYYVGGKLEGIQLPAHYDFQALRITPKKMQEFFKQNQWEKVTAFQTRNPMHKAHYELTLQTMQEFNTKLLIHPVVGMTKPGDIDHFTRVRCYRSIQKHYPKNTCQLALLPLSMRMAGPKEALWHAIIRKNYGCTHLIIGRDHASPGKNAKDTPFYGPYEAQDLLKEHEDELGIKMVPFKEVAFIKSLKTYLPADKFPKEEKPLHLSGTEFRHFLRTGHPIPSWFTFKEVVDELRKTHPPRNQKGLTIFFTGLSGSGKSTIANILAIKLLEIGGRPVTLLAPPL